MRGALWRRGFGRPAFAGHGHFGTPCFRVPRPWICRPSIWLQSIRLIWLQEPICPSPVLRRSVRHLRRRPLRVRVIVRQFRSAPSYQIMELMISAAKGARINTFICGRLMGAPNGEVGRCCRSLDQNHTSNKIILPAPVRSSSTKAQRRRQTDQKEFKPSHELCSYPHRLGAWRPISVMS